MTDCYKLLGVGPLADASDIRRAYREHALRHHPDKNPDRMNQATECFKLIAEAYSVLQDPQTRADYDLHIYPNTQHGVFHSQTAWAGYHVSADKSRDLFKEVFGEEAAAGLLRVAASTAAATADRVSKASFVRGPVSCGLASLRDEAESAVASKRIEEALAKACWQERLLEFNKHTSNHSRDLKARLERRETFCQRLQWRKRRSRRADEQALDREVSITSTRLRQQLHAAEMPWAQSRKELVKTEASAIHASTELVDVRRHGVSFGHAAAAGAYLLTRMAEKVRTELGKAVWFLTMLAPLFV
jgi:curved DNA-binding protein CbpA